MTVDAALRAEGDGLLWYHTMELAPGWTTPGWFDLRPIVDRMPWPDVRGKRCLDVGTYDGYLAFEMERRGASEVVAVDLDDHQEWDWPLRLRSMGGAALAELAGPEKGAGFRVAAQALSSGVRRVATSVYRLADADLGTFDVVVCGSLLLHLRDPIAALEAIRSVCRGQFLSAETIDLPLTVVQRRRPAARLDGYSDLCQWWTPNTAGHARMLMSAGFTIERSTKPYAIPYGVAHSPRGRAPRDIATRQLRTRLCGNDGIPHVAALTRPTPS